MNKFPTLLNSVATCNMYVGEFKFGFEIYALFEISTDLFI